ncbi:MAG: DUF2934 domain-containing protein [Cyanothece sp. SIO2G6]|nr:DUF2934 domain-containing protein [Cyanothece sp. SIO2G6]
MDKLDGLRYTYHIQNEEIRQKAYQIWKDNGRLAGRDIENWNKAEQEIRKSLNSNKLLSLYLRSLIGHIERGLPKSRTYNLFRNFAPFIEAIGIVVIPIVILFVTLYNNNQRDIQESATRGQNAVKNYLNQIIVISANRENNHDNNSGELLRQVTLAFWQDPNIGNIHKKQVLEALIDLQLVQEFEDQKPVISLEGMILDSINLSDADLRGVDFSNASLRNTDLRGVNLSNANLTKANLTGAILTGANLNGATLNQTELSDAQLSSADFRRANILSVEFSAVDLNGADFRDSVLKNVNFLGADLAGVSFVGAKLDHITFTNADLRYSRLYGTGTDLAYMNFDNANLSDAQLNNTCLVGASFIKADFSRANLTGAVLSKDENNCIDDRRLADYPQTLPSTSTDDDAPRSIDRIYIPTYMISAPLADEANIRGANFLGAEGLSPQQIKSARNWESATYDSDFRQQLGLLE